MMIRREQSQKDSIVIQSGGWRKFRNRNLRHKPERKQGKKKNREVEKAAKTGRRTKYPTDR